ncbi:ImmA/IrrE family metallo-endopeptidase [Bacillus sp. SCS-151]|uniref:ImmA/IrrE family metallo-endopeptidase n=1 Tax=Nanhaiella sioensis TaxID=3115293 RepID=UPI00397E3510
MEVVYEPTHLETWVSVWYKKMNIHQPSDILEETICQINNIYFFRRPIPSYSYENGKFKSITVDSRVQALQQREQFFHELCHILRHYGWQLQMMPPAFRDLQERDAQHFTLYAAIPYHMIMAYNLKSSTIIDTLIEDFKVSEQLCTERVRRIFRNSSVVK